MRDLEALLREHTGCTCVPFHEIAAPYDYETELPAAEARKRQAAAGSALFHDYARAILALPGHERHAMNITDEEYAAIVGPRGEPAHG